MNAITDKELLELAAKAAGIDLYVEVLDSGWYELTNQDTLKVWNPLSDDGDAFRLFIKLEMMVDTMNRVIAGELSDTTIDIDYESYDQYAATRRAIVRAAYEIGKDMK